jgi:hypothetical protein
MPQPPTRRMSRAVDPPAFMELTPETLDGFLRFTASEGNASYFEDVLKTRMVCVSCSLIKFSVRHA